MAEYGTGVLALLSNAEGVAKPSTTMSADSPVRPAKKALKLRQERIATGPPPPSQAPATEGRNNAMLLGFIVILHCLSLAST